MKQGTDEEIAAAFDAYDAMRREHSQKLVTTSRAVSEIYEFQSMGNKKEDIAGTLSGWYNWIWNHDLEKDLKEAFRMMDARLSRTEEMRSAL